MVRHYGMKLLGNGRANESTRVCPAFSDRRTARYNRSARGLDTQLGKNPCSILDPSDDIQHLIYFGKSPIRSETLSKKRSAISMLRC